MLLFLPMKVHMILEHKLVLNNPLDQHQMIVTDEE